MSPTENGHSAFDEFVSPPEEELLQNTVTQQRVIEVIKKINTFIAEYDNGVTHLLREREIALSNVRNKINEVNRRVSEANRTLTTTRESAARHLTSEKIAEPFELSLNPATYNVADSNLLDVAERHVNAAQQALQNLQKCKMPGYIFNIVGISVVLGIIIGGCVGAGNQSFGVFMFTALFISGAGGGLALIIHQSAKSGLHQHFAAVVAEKDAAEQYLRKCPNLITMHNKEAAEAAARSYQNFIRYAEVMKNKSGALHDECREIWDDIGFAGCFWDDEQEDWESWKLSSAPTPSVCFGSLINYKESIQGVGDESIHFFETLNQNVNFPQVDLDFEVPALMSISKGRGILFETVSAARNQATDAVRSVMLRLLATMPPGMVYFTMIDPVAMGDNVAAFMPLGKYDEKLITAKAWSEPQHIEEQLSKLTEHISEFIQMKLRNEHATIEEYNQKARVKEPYRILVVTDFPANFNDTAARRLVSIAQNGPRCGVYPIIVVDTDAFRQKSPYGFNLQSLEQFTEVIQCEDEDFIWNHEDLTQAKNFWDVNLNYGQLNLSEHKDRINTIIKAAGEKAQTTMKVEVPFEELLESAGLSEDKFWSETTIDKIVVPLGPHNVEENQDLVLGKGTAHHGIIIGKTGSGKTNLMDIIITTLALKYSPDEIRFYLIDLKKGVGFKPYSDVKLPHAEVIAIDSEREFALSVLRGLVKEMDGRGDLFRSRSVDNIKAYREKMERENPAGGKDAEAKMPRLLLVVDEFQNLFLEDDQIGRDAAMILDRLAREGRSFGIHILLGSQSLAGKASNMSSSTLGQIGIRIALMCNESDARQIMADDNAEARLLSRPGEAIYNAQNGLIEGNRRFQVALFKDDIRQKYLQKAAAKANGHYRKPVIFEGNASANLENCEAIQKIFSGERTIENKRIEAWLGEPIALSDKPTGARFRPQTGSNLLVVSGDESEGVGILTSAWLSLAVQQPPEKSDFFIFNFSNSDEEWHEQIKGIGEMLPHRSLIVGRHGMTDVLQTLLTEASARAEGAKGDGKSKYLLIYGLQRAKDLRPEDGGGYRYSYDADEKKEATPADLFAKLLRESAETGVHVLIWCDMMSNAKRVLDRKLLNEFGLRVGGRMSQSDSQELLDNSAASRLDKPHRAIFYEEDRPGHLEKFRPFAIPSSLWIKQLAEDLSVYHNRQTQSV